MLFLYMSMSHSSTKLSQPSGKQYVLYYINILLHESGSMWIRMQMTGRDICQQHDSEAIQVKQCIIWQDLISEMCFKSVIL